MASRGGFLEKGRTRQVRVAVVGPGYVGLPLAHTAFGVPRVIKESPLLVDATGATRRFPQTDAVIRL